MAVKNYRPTRFPLFSLATGEQVVAFGPLQPGECVESVVADLIQTDENELPVVSFQVFLFPRPPVLTAAGMSDGIAVTELCRFGELNPTMSGVFGTICPSMTARVPLDFQGGGLYRYLAFHLDNTSGTSAIAGVVLFDLRLVSPDRV